MQIKICKKLSYFLIVYLSRVSCFYLFLILFSPDSSAGVTSADFLTFWF